MENQIAPKGAMKLTAILRILGGLAILSAGVAFLFQNYQDSILFSRITGFCLLIISVFLTGQFCSHILKEKLGTRAAMMAALLLIPCHFLQFGAGLFAKWNGIQTNIPELLRLAPVAGSQVAVNLALTAILFLVIRFAFAELVKAKAVVFSVMFFLSNAVLLLPVRDSSIVALLIAGMFVALLCLEKYSFSDSTEMDAAAHRCRLLLFLPIGCLLLRTVILYPIDNLFLAVCFGSISYLLGFVCAPRLRDGDSLFLISSLVGMKAAHSLMLFIVEVCSFLAGIEFLLLGAAMAAYQYFIARYTLAEKNTHYGIAAFIFAGAALFQFFDSNLIVSGIALLASSVALVSLGWSIRHRFTVEVGFFTFLLGILHHWHLAIELYKYNAWLTLGVGGIIVIILSSLIEKNYAKIKSYVQKHSQELDSKSENSEEILVSTQKFDE